jgi:hypothetical protein
MEGQFYLGAGVNHWERYGVFVKMVTIINDDIYTDENYCLATSNYPIKT